MRRAVIARSFQLAWALACVFALTPAAAARPLSQRDAGPGTRPGAPQVEDLRRIDVNDISMVMKNTGSFAYDTQNGAAGFEYPKGSGHTALFASGLWLGAMVGGEVRVAVAEYSDEFRPGAMLGSVPDDPAKPEYKVYKLERSYASTAERDAALADYNAGALPHGAPLVVVKIDGTLSIPGDEMLWCVFNDADPTRHNNQLGHTLPLGVEVQLTAFAFSPPGGGPAARSVILRYLIVNKGFNALTQLHVGMWVDPDLGGATDDLVGCDRGRSLGYVYNGPHVDDQYGSTPPSVGFDLFRGPADSGGGPLGLTSFTTYTNGGGPATAQETYNVLRGLNPSGTPMIDPTTGLPTTFAVSGDPVLGTGWLDSSPADKRMLLASGPVDLAPGQSQEVDWAVMVGQGSNRIASISKLRCTDEVMQGLYDQSFQGPFPGDITCPEVLNCPRPAAYWFDQFSPGGNAFSPSQLLQIAQRVDAASLFLDWSANPVASLRAALDPANASTPQAHAIREFAAFQCNLAVSNPPIPPASGGPIFLDGATPHTCPGVPGTSLSELGATAAIGLSDASYVDVGPNPPALAGFNAGFALWDGGAGYAADAFGSSIPSGTNAHTVEIRFTGGAPGQYAYRYLRTLDGGGNRVYMIQDYVPVPFTIWDTDANVQLNAAFLENAGPPPSAIVNGLWDPDDSGTGGRELVWAMDSPYSGDATPDSKYFTDPNLQDMLLGNVDLRYVMWPRRTAPGAVIDAGDKFRWTWGGIIPGPGVDGMLFHLAGLAPGDPAADQGYDDIATCVGGINSGIGIGPTCDVPTPVQISLAGTDVGPDHVTLTWFVGGTAATQLAVERREHDAAWTSLGVVAPDGRGMIEYRDADVRPGVGYDYRLRVNEGGGLRWLGDVTVLVPLENVLQLEGFHPNPSGLDVQLAFTLATRGPARIAVYDVSGRRVFSRDVGALGPGRHLVPLARGGALPSGIYVVQLTQDGRTITRRATALR